jgi:hypothetical protein
MIKPKNDEVKAPCPFNKMKKCRPDCILFRKGIRYNETKSETYPFSDCAINLIADNLEMMHNRTYMMQSEVGETKNIMAMKMLSEVANLPPEEVAKQALKMLGIKPGDDVSGTKIQVDDGHNHVGRKEIELNKDIKKIED